MSERKPPFTSSGGASEALIAAMQRNGLLDTFTGTEKRELREIFEKTLHDDYGLPRPDEAAMTPRDQLIADARSYVASFEAARSMPVDPKAFAVAEHVSERYAALLSALDEAMQRLSTGIRVYEWFAPNGEMLIGTGKDIARKLGESELEAERLRVKLDLYESALTKISSVRDDIIGRQTINWSAHIYPIVAALGDAGLEGAGYDEARKNSLTLIDMVNAAEAERDKLAAENAELKARVAGWDELMLKVSRVRNAISIAEFYGTSPTGRPASVSVKSLREAMMEPAEGGGDVEAK